MKKILLLIGLLLLPSVLALTSENQCLNDTHLETLIEWSECDTTCTDKNITQVVNCTHGCDAALQECEPPPYENYLFIIAAIFVIIIIIALVFKR